ncbi:ATPase family AAA domain-containing protein 5 [Coregonus clupeaformis]|uniref:ATPase family AAA domain-containing protein 5 n=1 Tax=Coregonus clupeaformis TaxID=59861 RepID=UPI001E1C4FE3|nr:ATPase family AAA domain-containing protein 5 [Coregonus clupeaformis]
MAGVVAMASVIEDFETQPCKKSRKDAHAPPVMTITNYFSPVPKPMEKPFSPPRSNNIMDYFSRKTTPVREKGSTPEQTKENRLGPQPSESPASVDSPVRRPAMPPQKRGRKPSKVARQLQETDADAGFTETEECVVLEGPGDGEGSEDNVVSSSCGILGSDTAALLAQFSADAGDTSGENGPGAVCPEKAQKDKHPKVDSKKRAPVKKKESRDSSPKIPRKDKVKWNQPTAEKRTVSKANAKQQQEDKEMEEYVPEFQEAELSLCDASIEVNVGEASQLNGSTVTISFEDFLQTQGQGEEKVEEESRVDTEPEDTLDVPKANEPCPLQISPRTLTIQAEVHTISPGHEPVLVAEKKMASIFSRGKEEGSPAAVEVKTASSPRPQSRPELLPAHKRKSNVVLQEEDLELSVVESESSTPKCSQTERKQFMSAFKQPAKPGMGPGKQPVDKASGESAEEEKHSTAPTEEQPGKKAAKKKPQRRGRKKALEEESVPSPAAQENHVPMETDTMETDAKPKAESTTDAKPEAEPTTSTPTTVRRSTREAPRRQTPVVDLVTPVRKTIKERVKDVAAVTEDCPVQMSTPKSDKSRHRVFRAQMVCPPDKIGSPIRMKLTRVFLCSASKSEGGSDFEILSPLPTKESNASKKRKKAKKLVEKARAIQQSKKAAADKEGQSSLRRSSRCQVSVKKSYNEDEDSVVCVEDSQDVSAPAAEEKGKAQKRSLNDVLGKKAPAIKESKNPAVAPMFLGKKAQRTSVISIFDDSSRDGSENSQDDEQFRARREFLKSGLPESFKKQVAKTAATKEAYAVSCSSFQPVVHVLQTSQDCPLWSLPWPVSPRLHFLKELCCLPSNQLPSLDSSTCFKTEPASRAHTERGSGWREDFSEPVRKLLMGEISASNPPFPVQRFLTRFLTRRTDHLQQCTASEADPGNKLPSSAPASTEPVGGKRKRVEEGEGAVGKVAKKQRSRRSEEEKIIVIDGDTISPEPEPPRRGGRGRRRKQQENEMKTPLPSQKDPVVLLEDSPLAGNSVKDDSVKEDVLWTEKYQPQHSNDIIGNTASVRRLHSWLREWKLRADREERKKRKEKKQEDDSNDSWDTEDGDSQEGEDFMCNTLLITGPTGVGKTAAVYACAQELGFKVFEVNASSQRSGRQILSQLKEATQSHQVDIQGVNAHKPCYFSSSSSTARPGSSPRKVNSPRRVVSSPRKPPQSPRGAKRGGLAPTSLANFFNMGRPGPTNKEPASASQDQKQPTAKKTSKAKESSSKTKEPQNGPEVAAITKDSSSSSEEQSKKTATSLILFEEVDVVFDDDSGFLAAIKTFMTTTKRPVILTTSDPTFSTMFDGYFEEIHFKTPSVVNVGSYLQLLCLAENMRTDARDVSSLLHLNGCDIRQSLLHLQFWTCSAGGWKLPRPLPDSAPTATELKPKTEETAGGALVSEGVTPLGPLPPCDTGCTESMLGLLNMEPERDMQDLFKSQSTVAPGCWELLITSKRRGIDLLYSNMEALLPLPTTHLTVTTHRRPQEMSNRTQEEPSADPQEVAASMNSIKPEIDPPLPPQTEVDPLPHPRLQQVAEGSETDGSPVKVSSRMKKKKKQQQLGTREDLDPFHSDSDSDDAFLSLRSKPPPNAPQTQTASQSEEEGGQDDSTSNKVEQESVKAREEEVKEKAPASVRMRRVPLTPEQRMKSEPVSRCLDSLAEFLDHMSLLDSSLPLHTSPVGGAKHTHRMFGLGARAETKDGMTDEPREECDGGSWVEGERAGEIQAAVEALSFQRCKAGVEEAWGKAQGLEGELGKEAVNELTLPVAPHRQGFRLTQDSPCAPKVLQRRREVMDILPSRVAGTLGNRPAAALDFLPFLRTICRSETLKEQGKVKRRFLHYLDAIHLGLSKNTLKYLAEDFP